MLIQSVTKFLPLVYSLSYYAFLLQKIYKIIKMFFYILYLLKLRKKSQRRPFYISD